MDRRNILTILGLAPLTTPAIASCDVTQTTFDGEASPGYRLRKYSPERLASALERLAAEVRNETVNISRFHIGSEAIGDGWLTQTLIIDIEVQHDAKAQTSGAHLPHYDRRGTLSKRDV